MRDVDISLGRETGANGNPSPLSRDLLSVTPGANSNGRYSESPGQLVYAVGRIGYEFVSHSRRDSIRQKMPKGACPEKPQDMHQFLIDHPYHESAIQWRLELDGGTPIYVIEPSGAFASKAYRKLRVFLGKEEGEEKRVAIPGVISGTARDRSGLALPVVIPELRGMRSWKTDALVEDAVGPEPGNQSKEEERNAYKAKKQRVSNFLDRVYYECHNLGREPKERALNFVVTTVLKEEDGRDIRALAEVGCDIEVAAQGQNANKEDKNKKEMALDTIKVERSPISRPGSDCWDVKLIFFYCKPELRAMRRLYQFTIDVTDFVPAPVVPMRSWLMPASSV